MMKEVLKKGFLIITLILIFISGIVLIIHGYEEDVFWDWFLSVSAILYGSLLLIPIIVYIIEEL